MKIELKHQPEFTAVLCTNENFHELSVLIPDGVLLEDSGDVELRFNYDEGCYDYLEAGRYLVTKKYPWRVSYSSYSEMELFNLYKEKG
jgi:hypothetical protein